MPSAIFLAALALSALLCAAAARRDLALPVGFTLVAFTFVTAGAGLAFGWSLAPTAALAFTCLLIVEADRRHALVPDMLTVAMLTLAPFMTFADGLFAQIVGGLVLGGTFLAIRQAGNAWRGAETLGWGDVKLAGAMGAVLGPSYGFAAVAIGGAATLAVLATTSARGGAIAAGAPFGVGLAAATAVVAIARVAAP